MLTKLSMLATQTWSQHLIVNLEHPTDQKFSGILCEAALVNLRKPSLNWPRQFGLGQDKPTSKPGFLFASRSQKITSLKHWQTQKLCWKVPQAKAVILTETLDAAVEVEMFFSAEKQRCSKTNIKKLHAVTSQCPRGQDTTLR